MNVIPNLGDSLQRESNKTTPLRRRRSLNAREENQNARQEQRKLYTELHDSFERPCVKQYRDLGTLRLFQRRARKKERTAEWNTAEGPASEKGVKEKGRKVKDMLRPHEDLI